MRDWGLLEDVGKICFLLSTGFKKTQNAVVFVERV